MNYGDSEVNKLMYKDKEVSGNQMLESGTPLAGNIGRNTHLYNVVPDGSNVKQIKIEYISKYNSNVKYHSTLSLSNLDVKTDLGKSEDPSDRTYGNLISVVHDTATKDSYDLIFEKNIQFIKSIKVV